MTKLLEGLTLTSGDEIQPGIETMELLKLQQKEIQEQKKEIEELKKKEKEIESSEIPSVGDKDGKKIQDQKKKISELKKQGKQNKKEENEELKRDGGTQENGQGPGWRGTEASDGRTQEKGKEIKKLQKKNAELKGEKPRKRKVLVFRSFCVLLHCSNLLYLVHSLISGAPRRLWPGWSARGLLIAEEHGLDGTILLALYEVCTDPVAFQTLCDHLEIPAGALQLKLNSKLVAPFEAP